MATSPHAREWVLGQWVHQKDSCRGDGEIMSGNQKFQEQEYLARLSQSELCVAKPGVSGVGRYQASHLAGVSPSCP